MENLDKEIIDIKKTINKTEKKIMEHKRELFHINLKQKLLKEAVKFAEESVRLEKKALEILKEEKEIADKDSQLETTEC